MGKAKIVVTPGDRYGQLEVIREVGSTGGRKFSVHCDCGNETEVFLANLRKGHTRSCGCLSIRTASEGNATHCMSRTKEYRCWQNIKERVLNPNHRYYLRYSVLGMEDEWRIDSDAFLAYMGPQPNQTARWTVGRIDNDVGYFKGNVRWEDSNEQNRNRRKFRNNDSGFAGVTWREEPNRPHGRAIATWYDADGKQKSKSFAAKSISKMDAIYYASLHRSLQIERLNREGAGYAEKHGA